MHNEGVKSNGVSSNSNKAKSEAELLALTVAPDVDGGIKSVPLSHVGLS